jgi:beta-galactosidase/beta-glucuronidase
MKRISTIGLILITILGLTGITNIQSQDDGLMTRWGEEVSPDNILPEYPRPQLVRGEWLNLNGWWDYAITKRFADQPEQFDGEILVPFALESALSGVQGYTNFGDRLWYHRTFDVPDNWSGQRVLLHFGAVDWETTVWVNGVELGMHQGGYDAFTFDITDALNDSEEQEIFVAVWDPTDMGFQPRGKQVRIPQGIWYTSVTGIWQTVWVEPVPQTAITALNMVPDIDEETLYLDATIEGDSHSYQLKAEAYDSGTLVAASTGSADEPLQLIIENPQLWSPDSPNLYDLNITLMDGDQVIDEVASYFGMRKFSMEQTADGAMRLFLNNEPLFHYGLLDQGFWPDGLYTAPTDEALRYDIEVTRQLGFNTIRKHVKVEPARWYYWADKLGILVWQDMPNGDRHMGYGGGEIERMQASSDQFELELTRLIDTHNNHPSIVMWVIFNEGWGQSDTTYWANWLQAYDPTRLVNSASGWNDMQVGDVYDIHSYPGPDAPPRSTDRASILGEFGGLGLPVEGHMWEDDFWGYRGYDDPEALLEAYSDLIVKLRDLIQTQGLAAAIYTQTTDVESEVNGMMTYDREVIKMDWEQIHSVNSELYQIETP